MFRLILFPLLFALVLGLFVIQDRPGPETTRVLLLAGMMGAAATVFLYRFGRLGLYVAQGQPEVRWDRPAERLKNLLVYVFGHRRLLSWRYSGILHFFIFWGFVILLTTIVELFWDGFFPDTPLPVLSNNAPLSLLQEIFIVLVLVGIGMALYNRLVWRPDRFHGSDEADAFVILSLIGGIMITLLGVRGLEMGLASRPLNLWMPFSWTAGAALGGFSSSAQQGFFALFWWSHGALVLAFLAYLPFSKHLHIVVAAPNVFFGSLRPKGALRTIDLENAEAFGAGKIQDFPWPELLDLYSCTECGRCQAVCPAYEAGLPLSPKMLIIDLRDHLLAEGERVLRGEVAETPLVGGSIREDTLWACTTCRACVYECPVHIEHIDEIVDMRRHLVLSEGRMAPEVATTLRNIQSQGNPWGMPQSARADWAEGRGVRTLGPGDAAEVLYWVGCAGAYDARNQKVTRSVVGLLEAAGVDFAILGNRERCTGDPARRLGEEHLFQTLARANIETLADVRFQKIITHCPHCFNTLLNEYSDLGGDYEVEHHSTFLAGLVAQGRLQPGRVREETVTFHDPCYLGRHNEIYDAPREMVAGVPGVELLEMARSKEKALCCGAGGGLMWMEFPPEHRINRVRFADARAVRPQTVATACPFCLLQLDESSQAERALDLPGSADGEIQVLDVAEILADALSEESGAEPDLIDLEAGALTRG
ncbi:MAG: heterodisulfide reductase-related iron-sulfur binding cluster [Anaerolineae bacterium]